MGCQMHATRYLLRGAQGDKKNTQVDYPESDNGKAYRKILEDAEDFEAAPQCCGSDNK